MILKNIRYLVTQNSARKVLEDVDLKIEGDRISGIGDDLDSVGHSVLDCSNKLVMPGLINSHAHVPMTLIRGISDDKKLSRWLEEDIFPAEEKMGREDIFIGSVLGIAEMLKSGTTCFNEMYGDMDQVARAVEETGIRAVLSRGVITQES